MKRRYKKRATGRCWLCGDPADASHGLDGKCYSSIRSWSANKTEEERAEYQVKLALRQARMKALDDGTIKINHIRETAHATGYRSRSNSRPARNPARRNKDTRSGTRVRKRTASVAIKAPAGSVH